MPIDDGRALDDSTSVNSLAEKAGLEHRRPIAPMREQSRLLALLRRISKSIPQFPLPARHEALVAADGLIAGAVRALEEATRCDDLEALLASPGAISELLELRACVARLENHLDVGWASIVSESQVPLRTLQELPQYPRYVSMLHCEIDAGAWVPDARVLFIGCGAFPLSALVLASEYGARVTCLDRDADACARASAVIDALRLSDRMDVGLRDAERIDELGEFDATWVALLVGDSDQSKERILRKLLQIQSSPVSLRLREPYGYGRCLYSRGSGVADDPRGRKAIIASYSHAFMKTLCV